MPRAAGSSPYYTFYLNGNTDGPSISLPSVTSILGAVLSKPALVPWAYKLGKEGKPAPKEVMNARAVEGTAAHKYLEDLIAGTADEPADGYQEAIGKWFSQAGHLITSTEEVVYSVERGYAGTLDLVVTGNMVVDVKTRSARYKKAFESDILQCTAYKIARNDMYGPEITKTGVLIAREDGTWVFDERQAPDQLFLDILSVYKGLKAAKL